MTWLILLAVVVIVYSEVMRLKARPRPGPRLHVIHGGKVTRQRRRARARWLAWVDRRSRDGRHVMDSAVYSHGEMKWSVPRHARRVDARQTAWLYED